MKSNEMMIFRALSAREGLCACKDSCTLAWTATAGSLIRESVGTAADDVNNRKVTAITAIAPFAGVGDVRACHHAKCILVDSKTAFITSVNFTPATMETKC
jgi:phosphatidylserine/phosphatidylglycerophosphate/cardiolipin synthase-like enzyme